MPKGLSDQQSIFANEFELKAFEQVYKEECNKQQIRIQTNNSSINKVVKSILKRYRIDGDCYLNAMNAANKAIKLFENKHASTNILNDFKGLDLHYNNYQLCLKSIKGWRNQNTAKYGKSFFKDMYCNHKDVAEEVAKVIFSNFQHKKELLKKILITSLHSQLSLLLISFENKHSRKTPLVPKNAIKFGLKDEIVCNIDDPLLKALSSSTLEKYGHYQKKQAEIYMNELDQILIKNGIIPYIAKNEDDNDDDDDDDDDDNDNDNNSNNNISSNLLFNINSKNEEMLVDNNNNHDYLNADYYLQQLKMAVVVIQSTPGLFNQHQQEKFNQTVSNLKSLIKVSNV